MLLYNLYTKGTKKFGGSSHYLLSIEETRFLYIFQSILPLVYQTKLTQKFSVMDLWISLYKKYQIWISFMLQSEQALRLQTKAGM